MENNNSSENPQGFSLEDQGVDIKNNQIPRWKSFLLNKFPGINEIFSNIEQENKLEKPPNWFQNLVKKSTDLWFDPKSFESEEIYEKFGIKSFKKYIPTAQITSKLVWKLFRKNAFISSGSEKELRNFEKFTRIYEAVHLAYLPIFTASMGLYAARGELNQAALISGANILINVYPILLQRYNRLRLFKAIEHAHNRESKRV